MRHLYACIALCLLLQSCGTRLQVARLHPDPEASPNLYEKQYRYGAELLRRTEYTTTVETNFYDATPQYLVFDVNVINQGDRPITFDPLSAMLIPDVGPPVHVVDPEMELLNMDIGHMRRLKNQRTLAYVTTGLMVAGAVYGIATDVGGAEVAEGVSNAVSITTDIAYNVADVMVFTALTEQDQLFRPYTMVTAEVPPVQSRYFWLDHALRITTIPPGEAAYGKLVFARTDEARSVQLRLNVEGTEFSFPYVQRIFRP